MWTMYLGREEGGTDSRQQTCGNHLGTYSSRASDLRYVLTEVGTTCDQPQKRVL